MFVQSFLCLTYDKCTVHFVIVQLIVIAGCNITLRKKKKKKTNQYIKLLPTLSLLKTHLDICVKTCTLLYHVYFHEHLPPSSCGLVFSRFNTLVLVFCQFCQLVSTFIFTMRLGLNVSPEILASLTRCVFNSLRVKTKVKTLCGQIQFKF